MTDPKPLLAQQPKLIRRYAAGSAFAVIAVTGIAWALTRPSDDTELAQWLPGIAGVATLIAAVVAAIFAAGAFRLEYRREIRLLDEAERAQAQSFVGWADSGGLGRMGGPEGKIVYQVGRTTVRLRNASNLPIYDASVEVQVVSNHPEINGTALPLRKVRLVPPNETHDMYQGSLEFRVDPPPDYDGNTTMPRIEFLVAIQFRDTAGRYWLRHGDGTFEKGPGPLRF